MSQFRGPSHRGETNQEAQAGPRVFLSYARESDSHIADVRRLHDLLAACGLAPVMDELNASTVSDWALWSREQIDLADWVLVIGSASYKRRADSPHLLPEDEGRGVFWEARYLRDIVYYARERVSKIVPVLLPGGSAVHLPNFVTPDPQILLAVSALDANGVTDVAEILLGRRPLPAPLRGTSSGGWVYAGTGAGRTAAETVREHIVLRGLGRRAQARDGDLFRGRLAARQAVTGWLSADQPPGQMLVVTGQPGAGKSAVVARTALDLEPAAIADGRPLGLIFHARSATLFDFLHAMAVITRTAVTETVSSLFELARNAAPPRGRPWQILVDALDEAASTTDRDGLVQALTALASLPTFRVVVATRALSSDGTSRFGGGSLLPQLGVHTRNAPNLVDLDSDLFFEPADLRAFVSALLRQDQPTGGAWQAYSTDTELSARLAAAIAARAERNYLVAALTADPLARQAEIVDPDGCGFDPRSLPTSVGEALAKYLDRQPPLERENVRGLLTALAYGRGNGVNDDLWTAFAAALGFDATVAHLQVLRHGAAADYLLQTSTVDGQRITRLFHQALVDELLAAEPRRSHEAKILGTLLPGQSADWTNASDYAKSYAAAHAAAAGQLPLLLKDSVYPTVADLDRLLPLLPARPDAELAAVVAVLRTVGTHAQGLSPVRRAGLLSLAAAHFGLTALARRYHRPGNLEVIWAHSRGSAHQTLRGHVMGVTAMATGRVDGRDVVVSGSGTVFSGDCIVVWDGATGAPIGEPLLGHDSTVQALAIGSAGGKDIIVSADADCSVRRWDARTRTQLGDPLSGHTHAVSELAIGKAGDRDIIVSASTSYYHSEIRLWDLSTGLPIGDPLTGHSGRLTALATGRAGDRGIIVAGDDKTVRIWDAVTHEPIGDPLAGHTESLGALATGRIRETDVIVSAGQDGTVHVWDAVTGQPIGEPLDGDIGPLTALAIGRVGAVDVIVAGGPAGEVQLWDAADGTPIGEPLHGHTGGINRVAISRVGKRDIIVTASADASVRLWDPAIHGVLSDPLIGHTMKVNAIAVDEVEGRDLIVSGAEDYLVCLWDADTGRPVARPLLGHDNSVNAVAISQVIDRKLVVSGSGGVFTPSGYRDNGDYAVRLWDAATGVPIGPLTGHTATVAAVAIGRAGHRAIIVSGGGNILATNGEDHAVRIWDAAYGNPVGDPLTGHTDTVTALAIGRVAGRDIIVSASADRTVRLWDAIAHAPVGDPLTGHTGWVQAVAIGRAGGRDIIASGDRDGVIKVWDAVTRKAILGPLAGHTGGTNSVTIGRLRQREVIVSASADQTVRLWDARNGAEIVVQDTLDPVKGVCLKHDRLIIAAGNTIAMTRVR